MKIEQMTVEQLRVHIATQQRAFEVQRLNWDDLVERHSELRGKLDAAEGKIVNMRAQLRHFNRVLHSPLARAMRAKVVGDE